MYRPLTVIVLVFLVPGVIPSQEVSQSGLQLTAPRAMVEEPVRDPHAMVASVNELATNAGIAVLRKGGNAVDAAVAVAMALAVTHPEAGNLGGSGHMLIRMKDGRTAAVDYSGTAPAATRSDIPASELLLGYKASVVPGTLAGLGLAQDKFGKLPWSQCLEPAYRLARHGFAASLRMELILRLQVPVMKDFPETARIFLHGSDKPLQQDEWVRQPDLAATIRRLQLHGWREFYQGETAHLIAADMAAHGGWITLQDLRSYHAILHAPIRTRYRGYTVLTIPPSASGGVALATALNILNDEPMPLGSEGSSSARHFQLEALRRGMETVRIMEGPQAPPLDILLGQSYADKLAATIDLRHATQAAPVPPGPYDSKETTAFSVVDAEGNMVTNTYTLSGFYGSQVMIRGAGFLMNNSMSVLSRVPGNRNYLAPHQRYATTMADTILLNPDGSSWAAFGSPGASTIPSTVLEMVNNLIDFKMSLRDAVEFPRVHFDLPRNQVESEPGALIPDVAANLEAMGYKLDPRLRSQGDVEAVMIDPETRWRIGASDGRRGGSAKGY